VENVIEADKNIALKKFFNRVLKVLIFLVAVSCLLFMNFWSEPFIPSSNGMSIVYCIGGVSFILWITYVLFIAKPSGHLTIYKENWKFNKKINFIQILGLLSILSAFFFFFFILAGIYALPIPHSYLDSQPISIKAACHDSAYSKKKGAINYFIRNDSQERIKVVGFKPICSLSYLNKDNKKKCTLKGEKSELGIYIKNINCNN
jgi:hypothetical protein